MKTWNVVVVPLGAPTGYSLDVSASVVDLFANVDAADAVCSAPNDVKEGSRRGRIHSLSEHVLFEVNNIVTCFCTTTF
jgi:hypothetical protein